MSLMHICPVAFQRAPDREPDISVLCLEWRCFLGKWMFGEFSTLKCCDVLQCL